MVVESEISVLLGGQRDNLVHEAFCKLIFWEPLTCSFPKPLSDQCPRSVRISEKRWTFYSRQFRILSCQCKILFVPLSRRWFLLTFSSLLSITKWYFSSNTFEDSVNSSTMNFNRTNEMCGWLKTTRDFTESQLQPQGRFSSCTHLVKTHLMNTM